MEVVTLRAFAEQRARYASLEKEARPPPKFPWVPAGKGQQHPHAKQSPPSKQLPSPSRDLQGIEQYVDRLEATLSRVEDGVRACAGEFESWVVVAAAQQVAVENLLAQLSCPASR
jgi:hypothetical protein